MSIHHSTTKRAEKIGVVLTEQAGGTVSAMWPKRALQITGASAQEALKQMEAAIDILNENPDFKLQVEGRMVSLLSASGHRLKGAACTPIELLALVRKGYADDSRNWDDPAKVKAVVKIDTPRSPKGVALDGGVAFTEGTPAADNPYLSGEYGDSEETHAQGVAWDEQWDAAADKAEQKGTFGGSVVSSRYRAIYAERGHPTHCGDWLANLLNNMCLTKSGTDIDRFEAICSANGVDMSKYSKETRGWQGRFRMTGRNLLAKRVYVSGVLLTPFEWAAEKEYRAPDYWIAEQKYKNPGVKRDVAPQAV